MQHIYTYFSSTKAALDTDTVSVLQHRDKDFQLFAKGFLSRNARQRRGLKEHQTFPSIATYEAKSASIYDYKSLFVMICNVRTC